MNRRGFVGLLGLFAGCSARLPMGGEQNGEEPSSVRTPASASNVNVVDVTTATPTPSEEPEPEPEPEPEVEPVPEPVEEEIIEEDAPPAERELTDRELRGLEGLASADRKITAVVAAFTDGYGTELTEVTASSVGFLKSEYDIRLALAEAQKGYVKASKYVANAEQETRVEQLVACWQFLRHTTQAQRAVVQAYEQLVSAHGAFEQDDSEGGVVAANEIVTLLSSANRSFADIQAVSSVDDTAAVSSISAAEYEGKLAQFETDIDTYEKLDAVLREFSDGVKWLRRAKASASGEDRHVQNAKEAAKLARNALRSTKRNLDAVRKGAGDDGTLTEMLLSLGALANLKRDEAEEILE